MYLLAKCDWAGRAQGLPVCDIWLVMVTLLVYFIIITNDAIEVNARAEARTQGFDSWFYTLCSLSWSRLPADSLELSAVSSSEQEIEKHKPKVGNNVAPCSEELISERTTDQNRTRESNFILLETMLTNRVSATRRRIYYQASYRTRK